MTKDKLILLTELLKEFLEYAEIPHNEIHGKYCGWNDRDSWHVSPKGVVEYMIEEVNLLCEKM